jgi:hypothetical protein
MEKGGINVLIPPLLFSYLSESYQAWIWCPAPGNQIQSTKKLRKTPSPYPAIIPRKAGLARSYASTPPIRKRMVLMTHVRKMLKNIMRILLAAAIGNPTG